MKAEYIPAGATATCTNCGQYGHSNFYCTNQSTVSPVVIKQRVEAGDWNERARQITGEIIREFDVSFSHINSISEVHNIIQPRIAAALADAHEAGRGSLRDRIVEALRKLPNYVPINTVLEEIDKVYKQDM